MCVPPCAPQAVCRAGNICECSLGYEGDGHTCTGEQVGGDMRWEAHSSPVTWSSHSFPSPVADLCQDGRGGCSEHANCSQVGTVVTCACLPDYEGDGWSCRARNPCEDSHRGGCSEHADCLSTGPVSRGSPAAGWGVPVGSPSLKGTCLLSCPRTHGAVCATPAMWVMDCSVWRSPSHLWTAAWASPHRVTQMPCAQTCTSRVSFPACSVPVSYLRAPADCIPPSCRETGWCLPPASHQRPLRSQLL